MATCWPLTRRHGLAAGRARGLRSRMNVEKRGLWMAAKNASVSCRIEIDPVALGRVLATGVVPPEFIAHVAHLLDEAPMPMIVAAVEEAAARELVPLDQVWRNVVTMAVELGISRGGFGEPTGA